MKFETNLSTKDKKTIALVLGAGVVFIFGWFAIRPIVTSLTVIDADIEHAEMLQMQYKSKILNLSSAEALFNRAVNDLNESTEEYYPIMRSSDIDRMMTSYILDFGLYPEDLYITMPDGAVEEEPYVYSSIAGTTVYFTEEITTDTSIVVTNSSSTSSSSTDTADEPVENLLIPYNRARSQASSTATSGIQCANLTYVVVGSREECQALIDDLSNKPSMRVTGYEWSEVDDIPVEQEDGSIEYEDSGLVRLRIEFNLYMADVTDYQALVSEAVDSVTDTEE